MGFQIDRNGQCEIEGVKYPAVGFGTYPLKGTVCAQAVAEAAKQGYRIVDTATFYANFEPVGQAVHAAGREKFYLISKVWPDAHTSKELAQDLHQTLIRLQTHYLDAYLLHWPNRQVSIEESLQAMDQLKQQGLIRHIGLSNVNSNHLRRALEVGVPISWVQVEMHPLFCDFDLLDFCKAHGVTIQAWAPLARGRVCKDEQLSVLGKKHGKEASQVALRWVIQHGCLPLPGSSNKQHIRQNFDLFNFSLSENEMNQLNQRAVAGTRERVSIDAGVGFSDEFDSTYEQCWPK